MTDHIIPQKPQTLPLFVLTTRGSAIASVLKHPEFVPEDVYKVLASSQACAADWNIVFDGFEGSVVLLGIMNAATKLKRPVRFMLGQDYWETLKAMRLPELKQDSCKIIPCLDPLAIAIEYTPTRVIHD
jgi:hypothetical protein